MAAREVAPDWGPVRPRGGRGRRSGAGLGGPGHHRRPVEGTSHRGDAADRKRLRGERSAPQSPVTARRRSTAAGGGAARSPLRPCAREFARGNPADPAGDGIPPACGARGRGAADAGLGRAHGSVAHPDRGRARGGTVPRHLVRPPRAERPRRRGVDPARPWQCGPRASTQRGPGRRGRNGSGGRRCAPGPHLEFRRGRPLRPGRGCVPLTRWGATAGRRGSACGGGPRPTPQQRPRPCERVLHGQVRIGGRRLGVHVGLRVSRREGGPSGTPREGSAPMEDSGDKAARRHGLRGDRVGADAPGHGRFRGQHRSRCGRR